jgi:hypothetical protein
MTHDDGGDWQPAPGMEVVFVTLGALVIWSLTWLA